MGLPELYTMKQVAARLHKSVRWTIFLAIPADAWKQIACLRGK